MLKEDFEKLELRTREQILVVDSDSLGRIGIYTGEYLNATFEFREFGIAPIEKLEIAKLERVERL